LAPQRTVASKKGDLRICVPNPKSSVCMIFSSLIRQPVDWWKILQILDDLVWVAGGSRTKKQARQRLIRLF
jgi:hypothetical protein